MLIGGPLEVPVDVVVVVVVVAAAAVAAVAVVAVAWVLSVVLAVVEEETKTGGRGADAKVGVAGFCPPLPPPPPPPPIVWASLRGENHDHTPRNTPNIVVFLYKTT